MLPCMAPSIKTPKDTIALRNAFPAIPEDKVAESEERIGRYVALVYRIYQDICEDSLQYAAFKRCLTELDADDSMNASGAGPPPDAPPA
jgi:hypothetical protein